MPAPPPLSLPAMESATGKGPVFSGGVSMAGGRVLAEERTGTGDVEQI